MNAVKDFSIIIPTHNRHDSLAALLKSIGENRVPQLREIIIVDDSDQRKDISFPEGIRVIHLKISFRVFISRAKNIGAKLASCDHLFFIDDDNVVGDRTFQPVMEAFSSQDCVAAVMPSVLYLQNPNLVWVYATPFAAGRWGHELIGRDRPRNPALENRIYDVDALPNSSMVWKPALLEVGGFRTNLEINSSGDLVLRLKRSGYRVLATSHALIYHDVTLPGKFGYWSVHGRNDPQRVRIEIDNWFTYMKNVHMNESLFTPRALIHSLKFILPNSLSYIVLGSGNRFRLLRNVALGVLDFLRSSNLREG